MRLLPRVFARLGLDALRASQRVGRFIRYVVTTRSEQPTVRVLLISPNVGESHSAMASALAGELESRDDLESVTELRDFALLTAVLARGLSSGFEFNQGRSKWSYHLACRVYARRAPVRSFGERALCARGSVLATTVPWRDHPHVPGMPGRAAVIRFHAGSAT